MSQLDAADRDIAQARYVSLSTFRKSGAKVATPVWIAPEAAPTPNTQLCHYVFSEAKAGKVKRLRNSAMAAVAPCTATGSVTGSEYAAEAQIITTPEEIEQALRALRAKYGWQMWLADAGAKLTKRFDARAYLRITLNPETAVESDSSSADQDRDGG